MGRCYGNILSPVGLKLPLDLELLYGNIVKKTENAKKTVLEIGFGNGEYTVKWAANNPDSLIIGLEISFSCVERCARRSGEASLSNLVMICADARFMMKELFADESLDMVIMNFPCPWPKTRHAKYRVTAKEFADSLAAILKTGGVFELVTDEEWYAAEVQKTLSLHEALSVLGLEKNFSHPCALTTKYERKWQEMGKMITRLTVTKTKEFTIDRRTWGYDFFLENEEGAALHIKTGKPLPENDMPILTRASGAREEARWAFKGCYVACDHAEGAEDCKNDKKNKYFLVETVVSDDEFEQRCYLRVVERDGSTIVKLDGTAKVFLTPAVRFAVEDLARRLAGS